MLLSFGGERRQPKKAVLAVTHLVSRASGTAVIHDGLKVRKFFQVMEMLTKRVIPCLDMKAGRVVQSAQMEVVTLATLGTIKWSAQYSTTDATDKTSTKTVSGLNLDENATPAAESANAGTVTELIADLMEFSNNRLNGVNLVESRQVINNG